MIAVPGLDLKTCSVFESDGQIYKSGRTTPLAQSVTSTGYWRVVVCDGNRKRQLDVARCIVSARTGRSYGDRTWVVGHIDNDPLNRSPHNLEAITQKENIHHAHTCQRAALGERNGMARYTDVQVAAVEALLAAGLSPTTICRQGMAYGMSVRYVYMIKYQQTRRGFRIVRASKPSPLEVHHGS